MSNRRTWTEKQLREAVSRCTSYRQTLQKLGLREAGGNYVQIKKYIKEFSLDVSHFTGRTWNKGFHNVQPPQLVLDDILVKNSRYLKTYKLKRILFRRGLKFPKCELCGWAKVAQGGYIPVELDHINGDPMDNRIENLRILCPNCHSLTPTYRSRKRNVV